MVGILKSTHFGQLKEGSEEDFQQITDQMNILRKKKRKKSDSSAKVKGKKAGNNQNGKD